jgi:hypothetical protein
MAASIDMHRLAAARADRWARHGTSDEEWSTPAAVVVTISDETLLETLADLRWRLSVLLEPGPSRLLLDLSEVRRVSSATIAVLLWVKKRCRARSVHLSPGHDRSGPGRGRTPSARLHADHGNGCRQRGTSVVRGPRAANRDGD